jgi:hypothetical protein
LNEKIEIILDQLKTDAILEIFSATTNFIETHENILKSFKDAIKYHFFKLFFKRSNSLRAIVNNLVLYYASL